MKNLIYIITLLVITNLVAQNNKINYDGILLGAYIPEQVENIPAVAKRMFINKLGQLITQNGISDDVNNSRFILTPNVTVLTKNITATAPIMHAISLEVTLYIGDGIAGNLFTSESFMLKGVGTNENKAFISALKRLNPKSENAKKFIAKGKEKIVNYYNANCDLLVKRANNLEAQNKMVEALAVYSNIPETSTCFNTVETKIRTIYLKAIEDDCRRKLNIANSIWVANQDINAANEIGKILATVDPNATCFNEVKTLYSQVASRVKETSDRHWNFKLKELDANLNIVQAAKEVGLAYGNNQPETVTYNTRGWY